MRPEPANINARKLKSYVEGIWRSQMAAEAFVGPARLRGPSERLSGAYRGRGGAQFSCARPFCLQLLHRGGALDDDRTREEIGFTLEKLRGDEEGCFYSDAGLGSLDPYAVNKVQRLTTQPRPGEWELKTVL